MVVALIEPSGNVLLHVWAIFQAECPGFKPSKNLCGRSIQLFLFNPLEPFRFVMDDFS